VRGTTNYTLYRKAPFVATPAFVASKLIGKSTQFPREHTAAKAGAGPRLVLDGPRPTGIHMILQLSKIIDVRTKERGPVRTKGFCAGESESIADQIADQCGPGAAAEGFNYLRLVLRYPHASLHRSLVDLSPRPSYCRKRSSLPRGRLI
jgi:hypothetical protein